MFTQLPESPKLRAFRSLVLGHAKRKALAEETDSETTRRSEDFSALQVLYFAFVGFSCGFSLDGEARIVKLKDG